MTNELESFLALCRFLSPWQDEESTESLRRLMEAGAIDWPAIIGLANRHMVTPALHGTLLDRGISSLIPADAHDFLRHIYKSNELRNTQMKGQAEDLVRALNATIRDKRDFQ